MAEGLPVRADGQIDVAVGLAWIKDNLDPARRNKFRNKGGATTAAARVSTTLAEGHCQDAWPECRGISKQPVALSSQFRVGKPTMWSRPRIMASLDRLVALGLSVVLAVQVAAAFLPPASLAVGVTGNLTLVLCSADGTQTITLSADGTPVERPAQPPVHGHCPLCIVSADLPDCTFGEPRAERVASLLRFRHAGAPQVKGQPRLRTDAIRAPPQTV